MLISTCEEVNYSNVLKIRIKKYRVNIQIYILFWMINKIERGIDRRSLDSYVDSSPCVDKKNFDLAI